MTILIISTILFIITLLYIHFSKSKEITKEEYNKKCEKTRQGQLNKLKRQINRKLNRCYSKFRIESKHNFDEILIEEYLSKLNFKKVIIRKGYGSDYTAYEFEINE